MIDITLLHQHNLFFHHLTGYSVTYSRVGFMPVHSFQFYRLAVDIVITAGQAELILIGRSVFDFHFPETDNRRYCLDTPVFMIFQFRDQGITIRSFCRPFIRIFYFQNHFFRFLGIPCGNRFYLGNDTVPDSRTLSICCQNNRFILVRIQFVGIQTIAYFISLGRFLSKITDIGLNRQ